MRACTSCRHSSAAGSAELSTALRAENCCSVMSWRNYSFGHACRGRMLRNIVIETKRVKKVVRSSIRKATRLCFGSSGINGATCVRSAGLEKHQSSVNDQEGFAFCLSSCNVLSCKVVPIQTPLAKERAAFDDLPHSIDYHGPDGLSSNSRAGAVNQPVAQRFRGRYIGAKCLAPISVFGRVSPADSHVET